MRTTLTLDDDVAVRLERMRREAPDRSFKDLVNNAIRAGLDLIDEPPVRRPFSTTGVKVGRCLLPSLDRTGEILAWLDEIDWLERHGRSADAEASGRRGPG